MFRIGKLKFVNFEIATIKPFQFSEGRYATYKQVTGAVMFRLRKHGPIGAFRKCPLSAAWLRAIGTRHIEYKQTVGSERPIDPPEDFRTGSTESLQGPGCN